MKKISIIFLIIISIALIVFLAYRWFSDNDNGYTGQYNVSRISANEDINNNINNSINKNLQPTETELTTFSTKILSDDKNRTNNIKITCSRINGTIVKAGKEFSFCDIAGQPSSDDGYKPADAFDSNGNIFKAVGGGNCQVSTTIYNAALQTSGLKITERHEHSRNVAYIQDGKDACVAYDYLDLKFKNTNDFDVKLNCSVSNNKVIVKIFKIS